MATITTRSIVDEIIAGDGYYQDDPRVLKIVEYRTTAGTAAYGLVFEIEPPAFYDRYERSEMCLEPRVIFEADAS